MERIIVRVLRLMVAFVVGVAVCAVLTCLVGCRSVRYVSVPEYHTEYKARVDSVLFHFIDPVVREDSSFFSLVCLRLSHTQKPLFILTNQERQ